MTLIDSKVRKIDTKGRLSIPPSFIDKLSPGHKGELVVIHLDDCLQVVGPDQWALMEKELTSLSFFDPRARRVQRLVARRMQICERDGQGRIRLSDELKRRVGIQEEVLIIGSFNRIELWNPAAYSEHERDQASVEQQLGELFGGRE